MQELYNLNINQVLKSVSDPFIIECMNTDSVFCFFRKQISSIITDTIKNLIQSGHYAYNENENSTNIPLKLSDIAVLCYNRKDANIIKKALNQAGISSAVYKQAGLFRTPEANEIYTLLNAIAYPYDRSAIRKDIHTLFFNFSLSEIKIM